MTAILQSPYGALVAFVVALSILTQALKWLAALLGFRKHPAVVRVLPFVPILVGAVAGALMPRPVGVAVLVVGDAVPQSLGAVYGGLLGFVSAGAYSVLIEQLPAGHWLEQVLKQTPGDQP